jgi:hypothetical protein
VDEEESEQQRPKKMAGFGSLVGVGFAAEREFVTAAEASGHCRSPNRRGCPTHQNQKLSAAKAHSTTTDLCIVR